METATSATGVAWVAGYLMFLGVITLVSCAVWVLVCWAIAKNKNLPKAYMWFGLLGLIGVIVVACQSPRTQTPYAPYMPPQQMAQQQMQEQQQTPPQ